MEPLKKTFFERVFLGRETDFSNPEEVILSCIKLAYRDMLTAGRFYLPNDKEGRCEGLYNILSKHQYVFSRNIIDDALLLFGDHEIIGNGTKYVTRYGLAQKFVNMSFKYFYLFDDLIDKDIDFSMCDCPLDSIILSEIPEADCVWSKLTKEKYEKYQDCISDKLSKVKLEKDVKYLGNMAFDFLYW